jgi:hypothetical protein
MHVKVLGRDLDTRLALLLAMLVLFNGLPVLCFVLYLALTSCIVALTALIAEIGAMFFGFSLLVPCVCFCSLAALLLTLFIVAVSAFFNLQHLSSDQVKIE